MPNLTGKMLGKVHVDMFLAKGGMAEVYIGTHTTLHRSVAVKFLKADLQEEPELRDRFEREARVIAMLRHSNIVQIFDFDSHQNQPYLVMEYVPGVSLGVYLRELHKNNQRLDLLRVRDLLNKVADALTYAHRNNVVHRDIKPANILLTSPTIPISVEKPLPDDVEPILTDFGLVRFLQSNKQTSTGIITGTPAYMSPEQARGDRVDTRSDVYSLGVTIYEMLAGRVPFESDSTMSVLHMHIYDPPPPIAGLSEELQDVMDRALAKDPEQRFQTPLEFARAFESALMGITEAETLLYPSAASKSITTRRRNGVTVSKATGKKQNAPVIIGLLGITVALGALAVALLPNQFATTQTPPVPAETREPTVIPVTPQEATSGPLEPAPNLDPVGLLRFQDGSAEVDQVTFSSGNLPPPPAGTHYEAWLIADDGESLFSVGVIQFDAENRASLTFVDPAGRNLLTFYHGMQITIEPSPDNNPNPSNEIAFSISLPPNGLTHIRHLLSEFSSTPNQTPFVRGLKRDTDLLNNLAQEMLTSFETGNEENVRLQAEQMLNLILGDQSPDHKDWNGDGNTDDPGDGYGLLLNGSNSGYIQGTFTHANLSIQSADATENMMTHGEHVMIAAENVSGWTARLRDQLIGVIEASSLSEAESFIRQAVVLTNQIRNGVDVNGNENVEPIPGEGGAMTAYEHSFYMADILLFP
ncbi:MAG: protein kinase [Anaerolineales bacterium]|nr:protein kinase [Anaerolineales bacterium]